MLDMIVDHYFIVMESLGDQIEDLEEEVVRSSTQRSLAKINQLRKEIIVLKRNISPVRDLVNGFIRSDSDLLEERSTKYFKDVYDHIVQANDLSETYRDMMINMHDLYLNNVNLKMNEVMKVMAIVTCLLAPATVIGGIFGMNFETIPWLHKPYGFFWRRCVNASYSYCDALFFPEKRLVLNIFPVEKVCFFYPPVFFIHNLRGKIICCGLQQQPF